MGSGAPGDRDLLAFVLGDAIALRLEPGQETRLSRLYWNSNDPSGASIELRKILTEDQLDAALRRYQSKDQDGFSRLVAELVDRRVELAVAAHVRDKSVVETELAGNVASKLADWAKTFGFFVAAPFTLILIILGIFGFQSFSDVRGAAQRVREVISDSQVEIDRSKRQLQANQAQLQTARKKFAEYEQQLPALITRARNQATVSSSQLTELERKMGLVITRANEQADASARQIAELQQRAGQTSLQVKQLQSEVRKLAGDFNQIGTIPITLQNRLSPKVSQAAGQLLRCAETEFNKNVSEGGKAGQIETYLHSLGIRGDARNMPWSSAFIAYCIKIAGVTGQISPSAFGLTMLRSAQDHGIWLPASSNLVLQPGDIYWICRGVSCRDKQPSLTHLGIVREVDRNSFTGVEGNVNNTIRVQERQLPLQMLIGVARLK